MFTVRCPGSIECGDNDCMHAGEHEPLEMGREQTCHNTTSRCLSYTGKCVKLMRPPYVKTASFKDVLRSAGVV